MQLLLVEDDPALASGLQRALQNEGFAVNHVASGQHAVSIVNTEAPDIVILDLGLPDIDGIEVLKQIRKIHASLPVLLLTARDTLDDKVAGLDSGADDYLAKPFDMPELLARLRVLERRLGTALSNEISIGKVSLSTDSHHVTSDGEEMELSKREYMLLKALMENAGKVQTRNALESKLYGWEDEIASNALEVHIHNLRKKFGADFIKTVRGVGYTVKKA
ncbi:MAG: response regulator [Gammaproteobacteria bacterium]|nr:response regulator [Gammaproteobacteria bacterium]MCW8922249.1 response regulator [Gammaproteobacteria bacterium]